MPYLIILLYNNWLKQNVLFKSISTYSYLDTNVTFMTIFYTKGFIQINVQVASQSRRVKALKGRTYFIITEHNICVVTQAQ